MEVIYFLLPIVVGIAILFMAGYIWMTKNGQYDDLETPAHRILLDDKKILEKTLNINPSINDLNKEKK
jgi:cbb3-type cytochrome oxidase maturation protein